MRNENLLSINDLVTYTGFKKSYLYKLHHQGKISGFKAFGKMLKFERSEIDKLLRTNKTYSAKDTEIEANTYSITK